MSKLWLQGIPIQTTVQKTIPVAFVILIKAVNTQQVFQLR